LERNRQSAEMLARTAINAVANQSRLEMFQANADVLDGVQWLATLDHRTCPICGAFDGKIWTQDTLLNKSHEIKVPPIHPNCRCMLTPHIDVGDGGTRPAEVENFDQLAKEKYDAEQIQRHKDDPSKRRKYDSLSYEYRRKLRYDAIRDYQQKEGKLPYKQVSGGTTFAEYLKGQSDDFQRRWLGRTRLELFKADKLTLDQMVDPDRGFRYSLDALRDQYGVDISPHEQRTRDYFVKSEKAESLYDDEEVAAIWQFSEPKGAGEINSASRKKQPIGAANQTHVDQLRTAIEKFSLEEDIVVYSGIDDCKNLFEKQMPVKGTKTTWDGFTSTSINRYIADGYSGYTADSAVVELVVPKGTHGIMMGSKRLSKDRIKDKEFLLAEETQIKVISVEKKYNGYYIRAKVIN
jgi:SPP1 gp7 family putative phage head morphogenesis protein